MFRFFDELGDKAKRIPALGWMTLYLALIPMFGLVYWLYGPTGFSHSTRELEAQYEDETRDLQRTLRLEFLATLKNIVFVDDETVRLSPLSCQFDLRNASAQGNEIRLPFFIGGARGKHDPHFGWVSEKENAPIEVRINLLFTIEAEEVVGDSAFRKVRIDGDVPDGVDLSRLFSKRPYGAENGSLWFQMHPWASQRLAGRGRELLGFTGSTALNDIVTMMYFSAVTITTLGYGDIAPVTPCTRILTALEAVLGLVVIGLFLNSLAGSSGQNPKLKGPLPRIVFGREPASSKLNSIRARVSNRNPP